MSGDRLAQIEALRRTGQLGAISVSDVLALVEIAKAARPFTDEYDFHAADYLAEHVDGEEARVFTARTVDLLIEHQRALRDALARLDSGAAEGDA